MLQDSWLKIEDKAYGFIVPLFLIYIFLQPFNHFAGIRNSAFFSMLVLFLIKVVRNRIKPTSEGFKWMIDWKDSTVTAFFILFASILISIIFSNYLFDSLNAFRKNFFYQIIIFFVILSEFRDAEKIKALLFAVVLSFITLTLIIIINNYPDNLLNIFEARKRKESFLSGYALNAAFYIPFAIGYLYSIKNRTWVKGFLGIMLFTEFVLVWLYYNSRTPLIAILISGIVIIIMSKRYKFLVLVFIVLVGLGTISYFKKPELFDRYKTLLSLQTYTSNAGLSGRVYLWKGTVEMIKDSPIIGYGYGWKKIALVARDGGYIERWKDNLAGTYEYFNKTGYGSANPHNLFLQILFEIGILGLVAFAIFWVTVCIKVVKIIKSGLISELNNFVRFGVLGVLIAHFIVNLTNGLWVETYGILTFTLAAIVMVIYDKIRFKDY